ncbi:D-2-hydroxyacid dehydrogenase [Flavitalea flava]
MKIIITDGYALNPGDLSWKSFDALGEVIYFDRTPVGEVRERCREADVIITNKTPLDEKTIDGAVNLKVITVAATGYNVVDIQAARRRGIPVCNVPEYGTDSVAQHTFALLLELSNQVGRHARSVREGKWQGAIDWCFAETPLMELRGKTLGLIGFGRIARQVCRIAQAFGMNVLYYTRSGKPAPASLDPAIPATGAKPVSMKEVFEKSDYISLHCPLTPENHSFINTEILSLMKPSAFLINTARGQLIREADLAAALQSGLLAGAALDVLASEPPPSDHPLISLANCWITPHNAWMSWEARQRIMQTTFDNVRQALSGTPQHVVNG